MEPQMLKWHRVEESMKLSPRKDHTTVLYKNSLYLLGGYPDKDYCQDETTLSESFHKYGKSIMKYNLGTKEVTCHSINQTNPIFMQSFDRIHCHSAITNNQYMLIFGGCVYGKEDRRQYRQSEIWSINLDTFSCKKYDSKGTAPERRAKPFMTILNKSYILLYGGWVDNTLLCDFHLYKLDNKTWITPSDTHQFQLPALRHPSITTIGDRVYIFGGEQEVADPQAAEGTKFIKSNNMYQLNISYKVTSPRPDILVKRIHTGDGPGARSGHHMMTYMEKYVLVMGGQEEGEHNQLWVFHPQSVRWGKIQPEGIKYRGIQLGFYFCVGELVVAYGGLQLTGKFNPWVHTLPLNGKIIEEAFAKFVPCSLNTLCSECHESQAKLYPHPQKTPVSIINQYTNLIPFPFQAIALFLDNALLVGADKCSLTFNQHKQSSKQSTKDKYILIKDNGEGKQVWGWKPESFIEHLHEFNGGTLEVPLAAIDESESTDKQTKQLKEKFSKLRKEKEEIISLKSQQQPIDPMKKSEKDLDKEMDEIDEKVLKVAMKKKFFIVERNRKQYETNLKIAGLRLGTTILYVSKQLMGANEQEKKEVKRVMAVQINIDHQDKEEYFYVYSYITENQTLVHKQMQPAQKHINQEYKKQLKLMSGDKLPYNYVYIGGLREQFGKSGKQTELMFTNKNDIYYGDKQLIDRYENNGIDLSECCDISLRAFISSLYLRRDMKISINVKEKGEEKIHDLQWILPNKEINQRDRLLVDIDNCFDFQSCKIFQTYYNPHSNDPAHQPYFHNGILFYHKSRLISRFQYPLGQILECIDVKANPRDNLLDMFGYLELTDNFQVNYFKTDFLYQPALEKYLSRLKFVKQYQKKKYHHTKLPIQENKSVQIIENIH